MPKVINTRRESAKAAKLSHDTIAKARIGAVATRRCYPVMAKSSNVQPIVGTLLEPTIMTPTRL